MNASPHVTRLLMGARRRVVAQRFWGDLGRMLMAAGGVLLLASVAERWSPVRLWRWETFAVLGALAFLLPLARALFRAPALPLVAQRLDRLGATHDRLTTALAFAAAPASPMGALALAECERYLTGQDFRPLLPWRLAPAWRWLVVPAIAVALVRWEAYREAQARPTTPAVAETPASPTVEALRKLAQEMQAEARRTGDAELKKLAEEIARRAELLRTASADAAEAEKAKLRELSALEQLTQEMQRAKADSLTPEELQALASALEKVEATRQAAEEMRRGDLASAARELEKTADKASGADKETAAAEAEQALREALQKLAEQQQLSANTQRQLSVPAGSQAESKLRQLSEMLRKMPPSQGGKPGQNQGSPQSLESLMAALQNLKFGEGKPGEPGEGRQDGPPPQMVQISPAPSGGDPAGQLSIPGANPGGEKDTGTTDSPFGSRQESAKKGEDLSIPGMQNSQGEMMSQYLPGGQDASRASRRYRELYNTLAPAAENAVLQEEIPLGSRLFIKRYFESIRPGS